MMKGKERGYARVSVLPSMMDEAVSLGALTAMFQELIN